jgi:hypothetical protein
LRNRIANRFACAIQFCNTEIDESDGLCIANSGAMPERASPELNKAVVLQGFDTLINKRNYDAAA